MCRRLRSIVDRLGDVVKSSDLVKGDIVLVKAGEQIPADGEVIEGIASVDESTITGESAPVIREDGNRWNNCCFRLDSNEGYSW